MSDQAYVMTVPAEARGDLRAAGSRWSIQRTNPQPTPTPVQQETAQAVPSIENPVALGSNALPDAKQSPEVALFAAFLQGDDHAFRTLFRAHNQRIFAYCFKLLGDEEQAQDIAQEVWEKVIDLRKEPPAVENPVGFLIRIARNKCLDVIKLRKSHLSLSDLDDHHHPSSEEHERSEEEELVLRALDRLPIEQKEVLVLNMYSGYRFDEIAEMLGKSPDAIWARASRGRAQLRKIILESMSGKSLSNRYTNARKNGRTSGKEQTA